MSRYRLRLTRLRAFFKQIDSFIFWPYAELEKALHKNDIYAASASIFFIGFVVTATLGIAASFVLALATPFYLFAGAFKDNYIGNGTPVKAHKANLESDIFDGSSDSFTSALVQMSGAEVTTSTQSLPLENPASNSGAIFQAAPAEAVLNAAVVIDKPVQSSDFTLS